MGLDMFIQSVPNEWEMPSIAEYASWSMNLENEDEVIDEAYWRKFHALHDYFIKEIQEGDDDCLVYRLDYKTIHKLKIIIERILEDKELEESMGNNRGVASKLLPEPSSIPKKLRYGQSYYESLNSSYSVVKNILEKMKEGKRDFYYRSSW